MAKYVTVASQYTIYQVTDEVFEILNNGVTAPPPQVVLEVLVIEGSAKRLGRVVTLANDYPDAANENEEEEDEDPPEGEGPWLT